MTINSADIKNLRKWWVLLGTGLAGILIAIDFSIVNICLPTIQHFFGTSTNTLQWLMVGFGLTFSSCLVAAGKFADIIGRRKLLYGSVLVFILASLGAGLAPNILFLIAMRILQGLSGAAIFPCGMAITTNVFPKNEHGRAISIYGSLLGLGLAIGPMLGGIIVSYLSWPWIFFINIPVAIVALLICTLLGKVQESKLADTPPIDWFGTASIVIGMAGLCFILSQESHFGLTSPIIIITILITIVAFITLYRTAKTHSHPILPASLIKNKGFLLAAVISISTCSISWVVTFYTALYLRQIAGYPIGIAALWFSILTVMTIIAPILSGYLYDNVSKAMTTHLSFITSFVGLVLFALFSSSTPTALVIGALTIFGFAWGVGNGIGMPIGLSALPNNENTGVVSGALLTLLNMGGTLFVVIATKIFTARESHVIMTRLSQLNIHLNALARHKVKAWLSDPEQTKQLINSFGHTTADKIMAQFHASFMSGFVLIFMVFAVLVLMLYGLSIKNINTLFSPK